jgi:hypothetical protein
VFGTRGSPCHFHFCSGVFRIHLIVPGMTCTQAALTLESSGEPTIAATGEDAPKSSIKGRRHSSYHPTRRVSNPMEDDFLLLKVGVRVLLGSWVKYH